jgi:hypothetical protein
VRRELRNLRREIALDLRLRQAVQRNAPVGHVDYAEINEHPPDEVVVRMTNGHVYVIRIEATA